jgi:hypothetical protein
VVDVVVHLHQVNQVPQVFNMVVLADLQDPHQSKVDLHPVLRADPHQFLDKENQKQNAQDLHQLVALKKTQMTLNGTVVNPTLNHVS